MYKVKNMSKKFHSTTGMTLIELMVVITIIGIIAVFGMGAYNSFVTNARRGEMKTNLNFIGKLQTTYQQQNDSFWGGSHTATGSCSGGTNCPTNPDSSDCSSCGGTWTTTHAGKMGDRIVAYGYRGADATNCDKNDLGFRVNNCDELRYGYWIEDADTGNFVAVAWAPSDAQRWLYPRCTGETNTVKSDPSGCNDENAVNNNSGVEDRHAAIQTDITQGDAWCTGPKGNQVNFVDIIATCE